MIGLDCRKPIRSVRLERLPENLFLVTHCESKEERTALSSSFIIALPDRQVLNTLPSQKENTNIAWDCRGTEGRSLTQKNLDATLALFQQQPFPIHAVDIESEAMARALYVLCDVTDTCFAILHSDNTSLWVSVFAHHQKIFFYQENLQQTREDIVKRAFKLFHYRFSDVAILNRYLIGDTSEISHWGIVPEFTQKLRFASNTYKELFETQKTHWLLACGLSLWDKKSSWNLLPWRDNEKRKGRKRILKNIFASIICGIGTAILVHSIFLLALHFQVKQNHMLENKINKLQVHALAANQAQNEIQKLQKFLQDQSALITFLETLNASLPQGVYLTQLELTHQKVLLTGQAETENKNNAPFKKEMEIP